MLMAVLGAGASYDSDPSHPISVPFLNSSWRPPLANELFENRDAFVAALSEYPQCHAIVPYLRRPEKTESVESVLQRLQGEASSDRARHRQLAAVRFYLQRVIWNCDATWTDVLKGVTNQTTLVDQIRHWSKATDVVWIVTFNYDTLIERSLASVGVAFNDVTDYIRHPTWKLLKPHGSINWVREIETTISMANRGNGSEVAREIINRADELSITKKYRMIRELPGGDRPEIGLFPAIAIPVETKSDFECPQDHLEALKVAIPSVDRLLFVGWRASEGHFLEMLSAGLRKGLSAMVVSGSPGDARETVDNLERYGIECNFEIHEEGFTSFVIRRSIDHLLQ